jgi:two-component system, LytTR family, response regulator LytT
MKIVIIEDEKLTAKDLARTINAIDPDAEIVMMLHSVEEALEYLSTQPSIDLIFSDIELSDGLSFEIFEKLKTTTPIIFCTAYNQYALEAFKTVGIDYILKPFSRQAIENTLNKFQQLKENLAAPKNDYADLLDILKQKITTPQAQSVIVHHGDKIIPLPVKDIALFYFEDNYAFAYTFECKKHILSQNMDTLEKMFSPEFFRANRQILVSRKAVKDAAHHFNRKIVVNLTIPFQEQILVGKLKVTPFMGWLAGG